MANHVYANGMEISCKAGQGKSICAFPDVCFTPPQTPATPPGVPIPYPNTGMDSDTTDGSKSVQISGQEVMLKNKSYFKKSTGDEAGSAPKKGVVSSVNRGKVYFNAWSMDVKFEGENVVRHLDIMTHNHASPTPNTPPWPFTDEAAVSPGGDCDKESKAIADSGKCSSPTDTSKECCSVPERKCVMVAWKDQEKKCCEGQTTGHHPIPVQEFSETGKPRGRPLDSLTKAGACYNQREAPTVCVEGEVHNEYKETPPYQLKEHGVVGNAYKQETIDRGIYGKDAVSYTDLRDCGAASVSKTFPQCEEKCVKNQLDQYHCETAKIPKTDPICRSSQQSQYDITDPSKCAPA